jgi:hypothetical protein
MGSAGQDRPGALRFPAARLLALDAATIHAVPRHELEAHVLQGLAPALRDAVRRSI